MGEIGRGDLRFQAAYVAVRFEHIEQVGLELLLVVAPSEKPVGASCLDGAPQLPVGEGLVALELDFLDSSFFAFVEDVGDTDARGGDFFDDDVDGGIEEAFGTVQIEDGVAFLVVALLHEGIGLAPGQYAADGAVFDFFVSDDSDFVDEAFFLEGVDDDVAAVVG